MWLISYVNTFFKRYPPILIVPLVVLSMIVTACGLLAIISRLFIPDVNLIAIYNKSSSDHVQVISVFADGQETNYKNASLSRKLLGHPSTIFRSSDTNHHVQVSLIRDKTTEETYSCSVGHVSGGCRIVIGYSDNKIKCACNSLSEEYEDFGY